MPKVTQVRHATARIVSRIRGEPVIIVEDSADESQSRIAELEQELAEAKSENEKLRVIEQKSQFLLDQIDCLVSESDGVSGLHGNGDLADWEWLKSTSWLGDVETLRDAIDSASRSGE